MFWPLAKDSVTVASRSARFPPDAVTSYTVEAVTSATVSVAVVAVVPAMAKSAAFTFFTFSLNVTRQVRLSTFVGEDVGSWRTMDVTVGAVVSTVGPTSPLTRIDMDSPLDSAAQLPGLGVVSFQRAASAIDWASRRRRSARRSFTDQRVARQGRPTRP